MGRPTMLFVMISGGLLFTGCVRGVHRDKVHSDIYNHGYHIEEKSPSATTMDQSGDNGIIGNHRGGGTPR